MDQFKASTNWQHNNNEVHAALLAQLEKLRQQSPESFSKPIYVLAAVDDSVEGQLKQWLRQESNDHAGTRIILIPYHFGNSYWVGILIEFEAANRIKRAEYIDPTKLSNVVPDILQKQFSEVYADGVLQTRNLRKQDDRRNSAVLMIENLSTAAVDPIIDDQQVRSITKSALFKREGNKSTFSELEQRLNRGLAKWRIPDVSRLSERIDDTEKRIENYEKKERPIEAEKEKEYLRALNELVQVADEIDAILKDNTSSDESKIQYLKQRLATGLVKWKIQDTAMLPEKIQHTREKISYYEQKGKSRDVERKKDHLNELEELLQFAETIRSIESCITLSGENRKHEYLMTLGVDLENMPPCAEKTTMQLLEHFERRSLRDCVSSKSEDGLKQLLSHLYDQVERQELLSEELKVTLQDLDRAVHSGDCLSAVCALRELLKKIRPLNVQEIQRLVAKTEQAAKLIRDKEIILLVGATGSGKSTTVQFLAGSKMEKTLVKVAPGELLEHIMAVGPIRNRGLSSVTSSPQMKSETRCITPVTVQLKDIFGRHEAGEITLCDAPGFGDTGGPEIDVANSAGVIEALKQCKSVKILALSSYLRLGDKGEGVKKLAHILVNMVHGIQDRLDAIFYAFTKYPETMNITTSLRNIKTWQVDNDPSLRSDSIFVKVLSDMIEKTEHGAYKIDPVKDDPRKLMRELQRVRSIAYPGEVFQYSMSEETQATIANQVHKYKSSIMCALKHKDIALVMYYLNTFKTLKDLIKQSFVRDAYEDSIGFVSQSVDDYSRDVKQKFKRALTSQDGLKEENIYDYKTCIEYIQKIQILREHLASKLMSSATLMQNIHSELQEKSLALKEECLHSPLVGIYLHNLRMLRNSFEELESQYNESCKDFAERCEKLVQSAREPIYANDFKQVAKIIHTLYKSSHVLKEHLGRHVEEKYRNIVEMLLQHLSSFSEKVDPILEKIRLSDSDMKTLRNYIEILRSAKENSALQDLVSTYVEMLTGISEKRSMGRVSGDNFQDLNAIYNKFIAKILRYFDDINLRIKDYFEKSGDYALEHVEKLVGDMEALRTIPEVESKTAGTYYRTVENIRGHVQQLQRNAEQFLVDIDNQQGIMNFTHLSRLLSLLKNAEWINRVIPGVYDTLMHRITEELVHCAQQSESRLLKLDLSLKCPESVCIAQEILEKVELMSVLERSVPELEKWRIIIFKRFFQSTQIAFDHIQQTFNLQDNAVYHIKQELKRLEQIKREYEKLHPARSYLRKQEYPDINELNREIESLQNTAFEPVDEQHIHSNPAGFSRSLTKVESIRKEYHSLLVPRNSISSEELNFLQKNGFRSAELLDQSIEEKKRTIAERERTEQPYDFSNKLDASAANNALVYVSQCEKVSHIRVKEVAADTAGILQKYIREYGNFLNKEIFTKFQHARCIDAEGGPLQYSHDLKMRLRELSALSKYARVFECMDGAENVEYWHQRFLDYYHTLSYNMEQHKASGRNKDLKDQLIIAQALSCLDPLCVAVFAGNGFQALYRQYQATVNEEARAAYRIVLDYISKGDYANIDRVLSDIDDRSLNPRDLAQIKHDLQSSINTLMQDTSSIVHWLDWKIERDDNRNQIREIKENSEKIRMALNKNRIMELLDEETQSRLRCFGNEMNEDLSGILLRGLNSIQAFMNTDSFSEAEQGMENLSWLQRQLAGHCTSTLVTEKATELRQKLDEIVAEISKRDDFADINNYSVNPPKDLLTKLKMVASRGDARFHQAYISTLEKIRQDFSQAVDKVRHASLEERSGQIHLLNHALCFLPEELQTPFKLQIDELNKLFTDKEKTYRRDLEEALRRASEDDRAITKLGALAQRYSTENMHEFSEILHAEVTRKLYDYRINVESSLSKQDMQSAVDIMKTIVKYRESVGSYIPEVEGIYKNVRELIIKSFAHCFDTLADIATVEQADILHQAFSNIIICIDFSMTIHSTVETFLPENVFQYGSEKFQNMCEYFDENSKKYRIAISKRNVVELHQVLIVAERWDGLVQKIRQCRLKYASMRNLFREITNIFLYADMIAELERETNHLKTQLNVELISDDTRLFERKRDEFFINLMKLISILREMNSKLKDILPFRLDIEQLEVELQNKVTRLGNQLLTTASKTDLSQQDSDKFRMHYNHISSFTKHVSLFGFDAQHFLDASKEKILERIISLRREIVASSSDVAKVTEIIIQMKFLAENLSMFDNEINPEIDEALKIYKVKEGISGIMQLTMALEKTDIGGRLIVEHSCLAGEDWRRRREKMQKQDDIDYALKELDGDDIDTEVLRTRYQTFRQTYENLVSRILGSFDQKSEKELDLEVLISETKILVGTVAHNSNTVPWDQFFKDKIPELVAHIFATWTLKNTQHYNAMRGIEAAKAYLLMPHVGQVIAIFRILGLGYKQRMKTKGHRVPFIGRISDDLVNNLVQIGTGEGKSVVMAVTACLFALIRVDVNCSCYSEVLSMRDKNDFAPVFRAFGIEERIEYGTFNRLCENLLNEQCNVREKVREMILNNNNLVDVAAKTVRIGRKVLLIDEVDVFLSEKFYGGTYTPSVYLKDPSIKTLLDTIWQNRTVRNLDGVKAMPAYKMCATRFSNWVFLFDEAIKDMLAALQSFHSSTHIVQNDRIVYVEGESIVNNVVRGYDTVWAYYHEREKDNISQSSLEANVGILVNCGAFSYAEMPHDFAYITGVTGTLKTLAPSEKEILKRVYAVQNNTFIPSVFGQSNRNYNSNTDVRVVKESEYFMAIRGDIDVVCHAKRTILVFFESEEKLMAFYNSSELSSIQGSVQIIMEKVSVKERELCIKRAATDGMITLLTRTFGRGTDFICRNQQLLANGGIHVLQTFFSEELSEEYQIMGRGARQGDRGSYRMILLDIDLEWVLGSAWEQELPKISGSTLYQALDKVRSALYESKCAAKEVGIKQCKRQHEASREFVAALSAGNMETIKRFLFEQNRASNLVKGSSRTVLLLDATGSMSSLLSAAKETVCTMFERASDILTDRQLPSNTFQMQIAVYRNYNSTESKILQASPWETKASNLREFLNRIGPEGGMGAEAIEIGLWHAVKESEMEDSISQVILIGDAPANTRLEVSQKRASFGEEYWEKTRFGKPTYYEHELQKLKEKHIPVHAFYLTSYAKHNFRQIASETRGRCEQLIIQSSEGAESLTNFVTEEVLRKAAGAQGDAAVELYRTRYVEEIYMF